MINPDADRPAYLQVVDALRTLIADGSLPAGYPLPSEQRLMAEYRVSRTTARRAVAELQQHGEVVTRRGYGSYVRARSEPHRVRLAAGRVSARPATRQEARRFGMAVGAPVLVIERAGRRIAVPADRVAVEVGSGHDSG